MDDKSYSKADLDAAVLQATTALKTEAAAALAAAMAANETAVAAARGEGAKAERERIKGVLASDEAKGREKSALHFAMSTSLSVDETKAALAGVAKDALSASSTAAHGLFLSNEPGPGTKAETDPWADVIAKVNDQNKKR